MNTTLFPSERLIVCDPVPLASVVVNLDRSPAASARSAREAAIDSAAAEYDASVAGLSMFCSRETYIGGALRDARLGRLDDREREILAHARTTAADLRGLQTFAARERHALSDRLGQEWDQNRGLHQLCTREAFVAQGLRDAGAGR